MTVKVILMLALLSALVAVGTAFWWDYTSMCADCASSIRLDNVERLLGEEGGIAGLTFFVGSFVGLAVDRHFREKQNG